MMDLLTPLEMDFRGWLSVHSRFRPAYSLIAQGDSFHQKRRQTRRLLHRSHCRRLGRPVAVWKLHPLEITTFSR